MWESNERELSRLTPRLLTCLDRRTGKPYMIMLRLCCFEGVHLEPMSMTSVLLSLRMFMLNQLWMS